MEVLGNPLISGEQPAEHHRGIRVIGQRKDAQVQTRRPPLGAANELVDHTLRHLVQLTGDGQRVDAGVGQVDLLELEDAAAQPATRQAQGRQRPTCQRQRGSVRNSFRQRVEGVERIGSIDQMHVVEHHQEGSVAVVEDRGERREHLGGDLGLPALEQILDMTRVDATGGEGTGQMAQEHHRVVVADDQRHPPRRTWIGVHPLAGERRLAVARTAADGDQCGIGCQEPLDQGCALQHARARARRPQALGDDAPGVDHDRLRHAVRHVLLRAPVGTGVYVAARSTSQRPHAGPLDRRLTSVITRSG